MTTLTKSNPSNTTKILGQDLDNECCLVKTGRDMFHGTDLLLCLINEAFRKSSNVSFDIPAVDMKDSGDYHQERVYEFATELKIVKGHKYIKIVTGNSVWGFIVNTKMDKKFKYGDVLKSASWSRAERNFARGNILEDTVEELRTNTVCWTGVKY